MGRERRAPRRASPATAARRPRLRGAGARRLVLLAGLACLVVGLVYAARSTGTYQDDDLDRYYLARETWKDPSLFLDRWAMPVPTLLFAAPARLFGYPGVEATTAVTAAATAVAAGLAAEALGLAAPWLAAAFFFFQPLVLETAYGGLAEPSAALLLSLVLWAWYAGRRDRAVLLAGLLPLARIEAGVLTLVVLAAGWRSTSWKARLGALVPVLAWNGIGFAMSGDPLWLAHGAGRPLNSLGPLQYVRNAVVVVGAVVLFFFLWALAARLQPRRREDGGTAPRFPALAAVLVGVDVLVLSLLAWDALPVGRSVGFLRHLVVAAPAVALVAAAGAGDWGAAVPRPHAARLALAALWTGAVALVGSHVLIGESFIGSGRVEWRWMVTAALALAGAGMLLAPGRVRRPAALGAAGLGAALLALVTVHPVGLDPERQAIQVVTRNIEDLGLGNRVVYTNHPWFVYFAGRDRYDLDLTPRLTRANLAGARPGSVVLWENHYGPRLWGDVPDTLLRNDPRYERLMEVVAGTERNFRVAVFLRTR